MTYYVSSGTLNLTKPIGLVESTYCLLPGLWLMSPVLEKNHCSVLMMRRPLFLYFLTSVVYQRLLHSLFAFVCVVFILSQAVAECNCIVMDIRRYRKWEINLSEVKISKQLIIDYKSKSGSYLKLGLHRISYLAPAKIRPYFHNWPGAGYEAGFDYILKDCLVLLEM